MSDLDKYLPSAVLEHIGVMEERYKARLLEVCHRLADKKKYGGALVYDTLVKRYQEPHRAYHTLKHIIDCLNEFEEVKPLLQNPNAVEMALLFHDAGDDEKKKR